VRCAVLCCNALTGAPLLPPPSNTQLHIDEGESGTTGNTPTGTSAGTRDGDDSGPELNDAPVDLDGSEDEAGAALTADNAV
jgi:hypothetical protein